MATLGQLACAMGEQQIRPAETIKVLGVLLDEQLTWEPHNAAAAGKVASHGGFSRLVWHDACTTLVWE